MYNELVTALKSIRNLRMTESEWSTRPAADFGTVQLDMDVAADIGDDVKLQQAVQGSVDIFLHTPDMAKLREVEAVLALYCDSAYRRNMINAYESQTGLFHTEYIFELLEV